MPYYQISRNVARNLHIAVALFQFVYIYSSLHTWKYGIVVEQWVAFPLLLLTGIWLRKGQKIWYWGKCRIT